MRIVVWGWGIALASIASGCQYIDMTLSTPASPAWMGGVQRGKGTDIVVVGPFVDRRRPRGACGIKKDGYNRATAMIFCAVEPGRLLPAMIADGLSSAGFQVTDALGRAGPSTLIVRGAIEHAVVEAKVNVASATTEADLWLTIGVSSKSGLRALRSFFVKGTDPCIAGFESSAQLAYETSVREAAIDVVGAIENLAETIPSGSTSVAAPDGGTP